jgi:class 3 adenylate cyclase/tetratricopeptide (TPR) repeat protein
VTDESDHSYCRFVPQRLLRRHLCDLRPPTATSAEVVYGAALFCDVVGYTRLTEAYARQGSEGLERLKSRISSFFGHLDAIVQAHGGDIVCFIGDAILATWTAKSDDEQGVAIVSALRCAQAIRDYVQSPTADCAVTDVRVASLVTCGELVFATVGGGGGQWFYLAAGPAIEQLSSAKRFAQHEPIVTTPAAWERAKAFCEGHRIPGGYVAIDGIAAFSAPAVGNLHTDPAVPNSTVLRAYLPRVLLERLDTGLLDAFGEFRTATVALIGLQQGPVCVDSMIANLQATVLAVQRSGALLDGEVTQVVADDKGLCIVVAWGIPGRTHEDDALRAVRAALSIQQESTTAGIRTDIGIATGLVYCGILGGASRAEYTVTGSAINLAARMMCSADGSIICDAGTRRRLGDRFQTSSHILVRGNESVATYRVCEPTADTAISQQFHRPRWPGSNPYRIVGREQERSWFTARVAALRSGLGAAVLVEGEAGAGKSRLLGEIVDEAHDITCLLGSARAIERHTPYLVWREIVEQILDRCAGSEPIGRRRVIENAVRGDKAASEYLHLFDAIVPLGFEPKNELSELSDQARADRIEEILLLVIQWYASTYPTLLAIDDAHWMDSASWRATLRLLKRFPPMLLVLLARVENSLEHPWRDDLSEVALSRLVLGALSNASIEAIICERLGIGRADPRLVAFVASRTGGNALFVEELCYMLRDHGHLSIVDGYAQLANEARDEEVALQVPDTVQRVIASRIDRLTVDQRETLKVASVIGLSFSIELLQGIQPWAADAKKLAAQLDHLVALDLLRRSAQGLPATESTEAYAFKHAISQDVAYEMLPHARRHSLHAAVAAHYESSGFADSYSTCPLLAHHWERANVLAKAAHYLNMAGEQAFERFAHREAANFLRRALQCLDRMGAEAPHHLKAQCIRVLGFTSLWLGEVHKSEMYLREGLALLKQPVPTTTGGILAGIVRELVKMPYRIARSSWRSGHSPMQAMSADAALGFVRLGHIAYLNGSSLLSAYTSLRCLSFAESRRSGVESAVIFAAMSVGAGLLRWHGLARRYILLAMRAARSAKNRAVLCQVELYTAMYAVGVGDWTAAKVRTNRALHFARAIGDGRKLDECNIVAGYLYFHTGLYERAATAYRSSAVSGVERGDAQACAWGLLGVARVSLALNRIEEAARALQQALPRAADLLSRIELSGLSAIVRLREGRYEEAYVAAQQGLVLIGKMRQTSFSTLTGTACIAEVLLRLWRDAGVRGSRLAESEVAQNAKVALKRLDAFAKIFPIGVPSSLLLRAEQARLLGRTNRAHALYEAALHASSRLGMPHERARAEAAMSESETAPVKPLHA